MSARRDGRVAGRGPADRRPRVATTNAPDPVAAPGPEGDGAAPRTALDYLRRATSFLERRGCAGPRLDAEVLLAAVLGTDRVGVYLRFDRPLGVPEVAAYRALLGRRAAGEPVAYLVGRREFWSHELAVTRDVLIPRPETELLVERALAVAARDRPLRLLDLGTGSGALAIALAAELPAASVVAVDVSPAAARVARDNARAAGLAARIAVVAGDWASALAVAPRFDVIVSNPPYVAAGALDGLAAEVRCEPRLALDGGPDGLAAYRRLVPAAARLLTPAGSLLVEVGAGQAETVAGLCTHAGLANVRWHSDLAGIVRVVEASATRPATDVAM